MIVRTLAVSLVVLAAVGCAGEDAPEPQGFAVVSFTGKSSAELWVDIADTPDERARGLMGVEELEPHRGMAFVWDEPDSGSFWMKDTLIPLSIAFVDERGRIVTIREMQPCEADPCPTYEADAPYVLAIEANRGWFREQGIQVGDRAEMGTAYNT